MSANSKVMKMSDAIAKYIADGDTIYLPWGTPSSPNAAAHEIIRQGKKDLTVYTIGLSGWADPLFFGKTIKRVVFGWIGSELVGLAQIFRRRIEQGTIEFEDYANVHVAMMLWGGKLGLPCIPFPIETGSDLLKKKGCLGDKKYSIIDCPFTGQKLILLPTVQPDVGIIHVQRSDTQGNAQSWGTIVDFKSELPLGCKKLIVQAEEIVDDDIIEHDPDRTVCPAYKVCAVVEEPWGSHPEGMYGHYDNDLAFRLYYEKSTYNDDDAKKWIDEWILGVKNRQEYIEHYIRKFGYAKLARLKPRPFYSASVNYGRPLKEVY